MQVLLASEYLGKRTIEWVRKFSSTGLDKAEREAVEKTYEILDSKSLEIFWPLPG